MERLAAESSAVAADEFHVDRNGLGFGTAGIYAEAIGRPTLQTDSAETFVFES